MGKYGSACKSLIIKRMGKVHSSYWESPFESNSLIIKRMGKVHPANWKTRSAE
jgi:hypothetical protein